MTLDGRVGEGRPVLRLGIGVSPRMVLSSDGSDGRRFSVNVSSGVQQHFGQRLVAADGSDHQRCQSVLADGVDCGRRQQLQCVRYEVTAGRAQHFEGQIDFQLACALQVVHVTPRAQNLFEPTSWKQCDSESRLLDKNGQTGTYP